MNTTERRLWAGVAAGIALIAAWYAVTRTTLFLAYRGGTLAQVQGLCNSSIGMFGRAFSAQGNAACGHINSVATWWNAAGFAGLLLTIACGGVLIYRAMQRPSAASTSTR